MDTGRSWRIPRHTGDGGGTALDLMEVHVEGSPIRALGIEDEHQWIVLELLLWLRSELSLRRLDLIGSRVGGGVDGGGLGLINSAYCEDGQA